MTRLLPLRQFLLQLHNKSYKKEARTSFFFFMCFYNIFGTSIIIYFLNL